MSRPFCTALLLMGGAGARFGNETPKQFLFLAGKKIYLHTLDTVLSSNLFDEILLVTTKEWISSVRQDLASYGRIPVRVIEGGATRQASSFNGLLQCDPKTHLVVIHDAVRPFVSEEILKENIRAALQFYAVDTCIPSADTLVYAPSSNTLEQIPNRAHYLRGQTPQSFHYPLILAAHKDALKQGLLNQSDDCSLVLKQGHPIHIVMGSEENIKITSELDLSLAEHLLRVKCASFSSDSVLSLKDKTIAVTGGSGGIGHQICHLLEKEGAIPLVISRSAPLYKADLTSFKETQTVFDTLLAKHGPLDGLINSVGYLKVDSLASLSEETIHKLITTNLVSVIYSCKCAKIKPGGHIINIASSSYIRGKKNYTVYASTKAALVNFTQGLAEERSELFINTLVPQRTRTALRLVNFPDEDPASLLDPAVVAQKAVDILKQKLTGINFEVRRN